MHTKIGLLLLVMLASQITATPIFKQINFKLKAKTATAPLHEGSAEYYGR